MKYAFCTSFSPAGFTSYGQRFLDSYEKHCEIPLHIYGEVSRETWSEAGYSFAYHDLFEDPDLRAFLEQCPEDGNNYRWQADRFSRKVFAVTREPMADCWIWIDADVEITGTIDEAFLDRACPEGYRGSYIGRKDWHHSECGFVAYRDHDVLKRFRKVYTSGELFALEEWHDSYVFDQIRGDNWFNLAEGISGMHPWPETILGEVSTHRKGPVAKMEHYG